MLRTDIAVAMLQAQSRLKALTRQVCTVSGKEEEVVF